jgi:hypothetical protein
MTRKSFLGITVGWASALTGLGRRSGAGDAAAPAEKPLFFKLSVDGDKMTQEIAVGELDSFEVVTQLAHRRWTVRGTTGRIADDAISVDLAVERIDSPEEYEKPETRRVLKLDGTSSGAMGAIGGMMIDQSVRRRSARHHQKPCHSSVLPHSR